MADRVPSLPPMAPGGRAIAVLLLFAVVGALTGAAAAGFIRARHLLEDVFDKIASRYLRHVLGMLLLGLVMYALFVGFGQYFVDGVGYATIEAILTDRLGLFWLLGLLFVWVICVAPALTILPLKISFTGAVRL